MNKLKLFYAYKDSNFGDIINPLIFQEVLKYDVVFENQRSANAIGIGSLLQRYLKKEPTIKRSLVYFVEKNFYEPLTVLGSGFIAEEGFEGLREEFSRKMHYKGLRGKKSLNRVRKIENDPSLNVCLGDPGLLASLLKRHSVSGKQHKYGLIAHKFDIGDKKINMLSEKLPDTKIISVLGEPLDIMRQMEECEIILSSAMHGLIIADSLNIPNVWLEFSDKLEGGQYKFHDYYSIFDLIPEPIKFSNSVSENDIYDYIDKFRVSSDKIEIAQKELLKNLAAAL